jgi:hypothetical protein
VAARITITIFIKRTNRGIMEMRHLSGDTSVYPREPYPKIAGPPEECGLTLQAAPGKEAKKIYTLRAKPGKVVIDLNLNRFQ